MQEDNKNDSFDKLEKEIKELSVKLKIVKKERQKVEKKVAEQRESLVKHKLEAGSEDENECLIPDISTSNKFGTLAKLSDKKIKKS